MATSEWSHSSGRCLFVGDLALNVDETDLQRLFGAYGSIEKACIIRRKQISLMYGFVRFAEEQDAVHALLSLNGKIFMGRNLRINWGEPNKPRHFSNSVINSIYVKFKTITVTSKLDHEQSKTHCCDVSELISCWSKYLMIS